MEYSAKIEENMAELDVNIDNLLVKIIQSRIEFSRYINTFGIMKNASHKAIALRDALFFIKYL